VDIIDIIKKGREKSEYSFYLSVVLFVSAGVLGTALIASVTFAPNLPARISETVTESEYRDVELVFNQSDIESVNSRLDEKKEFGWCLSTEKIGESRFEVDLRKGGNMNRAKGSISFSCLIQDTGRLHTHLGVWAIPYPSEYDTEAFEASHYRFQCVTAGYVNKLDEPIALNCYQEHEGSIERVKVEVE